MCHFWKFSNVTWLMTSWKDLKLPKNCNIFWHVRRIDVRIGYLERAFEELSIDIWIIVICWHQHFDLWRHQNFYRPSYCNILTQTSDEVNIVIFQFEIRIPFELGIRMSSSAFEFRARHSKFETSIRNSSSAFEFHLYKEFRWKKSLRPLKLKE